MRSIGFLRLGVDEKHGSLHAAPVLHGKEENMQQQGERKENWKLWSPESQVNTFVLLWGVIQSDISLKQWQKTGRDFFLYLPYLDMPLVWIQTRTSFLGCCCQCLPTFSSLSSSLFKLPNIKNLSFLYKGKSLCNPIIFGGTNISFTLILGIVQSVLLPGMKL